MKARVALCARRDRTLCGDLDSVVRARAADVAVRRLILETVSGSDNVVSTLVSLRSRRACRARNRRHVFALCRHNAECRVCDFRFAVHAACIFALDNTSAYLR